MMDINNKIKIHELINNDVFLNLLYKEKNRLISLATPKILFNLVTAELEYVIEDNNINNIDKLIEQRINKLKFHYEVIHSRRQRSY